MAKKKKPEAKPEAAGKTRLELRFDSDLAEEMKRVADQAGISVNQLAQGVLRWAMAHSVVGEPEVADAGWRAVARAGSVFFVWGAPQAELERGQAGEWQEPGVMVFWLDFAERSAVRPGERGY